MSREPAMTSSDAYAGLRIDKELTHASKVARRERRHRGDGRRPGRDVGSGRCRRHHVREGLPPAGRRGDDRRARVRSRPWTVPVGCARCGHAGGRVPGHPRLLLPRDDARHAEQRGDPGARLRGRRQRGPGRRAGRHDGVRHAEHETAHRVPRRDRDAVAHRPAGRRSLPPRARQRCVAALVAGGVVVLPRHRGAVGHRAAAPAERHEQALPRFRPSCRGRSRTTPADRQRAPHGVLPPLGGAVRVPVELARRRPAGSGRRRADVRVVRPCRSSERTVAHLRHDVVPGVPRVSHLQQRRRRDDDARGEHDGRCHRGYGQPGAVLRRRPCLHPVQLVERGLDRVGVAGLPGRQARPVGRDREPGAQLVAPRHDGEAAHRVPAGGYAPLRRDVAQDGGTASGAAGSWTS